MKLLFPLLISVLPGASVTQSQPSPQAPPDNFNLPFVLSVIGALITSFVVAKLYVWPALRWLPRYNSLRILASLHAFRFLGMNFVVVGFVSPALGSAVGNQIAWGDFIAAVLALFSIAVLTWRWAFAIPIVWIFNLWGTADLLNAYYKGVTQVADVGLFGAGIYIPALFVPILLTTHILAFMLLLKRGEVVVQNGNSLSLKDLSHEFQHGPHETLSAELAHKRAELPPLKAARSIQRAAVPTPAAPHPFQAGRASALALRGCLKSLILERGG